MHPVVHVVVIVASTAVGVAAGMWIFTKVTSPAAS